jgi:hypothetical protein
MPFHPPSSPPYSLCQNHFQQKNDGCSLNLGNLADPPNHAAYTPLPSKAIRYQNEGSACLLHGPVKRSYDKSAVISGMEAKRPVGIVEGVGGAFSRILWKVRIPCSCSFQIHLQNLTIFFQ